jgi:hypothetical protein
MERLKHGFKIGTVEVIVLYADAMDSGEIHLVISNADKFIQVAVPAMGDIAVDPQKEKPCRSMEQLIREMFFPERRRSPWDEDGMP